MGPEEKKTTIKIRIRSKSRSTSRDRTLKMLISNLTESVFRPTLSNTSGSATSPVGGGDTFCCCCYCGVATAISRCIGGGGGGEVLAPRGRMRVAGRVIRLDRGGDVVGMDRGRVGRDVERTKRSRCSASCRTWVRALRHPMVGRAVPSLSPCASFRSSWSRPCGPCPCRALIPCERSASLCLQSRRSLLTLACDAFSRMASVSRTDPVAMRCQLRVGVCNRTRSWFPCIAFAYGLARAGYLS